MDDSLVPFPPLQGGDEQVRKFGRQFSLLVSSGLFSYIGSFLLALVIARSLGVGGLGTWAIGFSVVRLISGLCLVGADWILLRTGSYYQGIGDEPRLRRTIHFSLLLASSALTLIAALVAMFAGVLSDALFHSDSLNSVMRLAALAGVFLGVRQILLFATQTFKDVRAVAFVSNIMQPVVRLLFVTVALVSIPSRVSAFVALVLAEAFLVLAAALALHRRIGLFGETGPIDYKDLLRFGLPAWGTRLAETLRGQMLTLFVGAFTAVAGAGYFSAARRIAFAPSSVNTTMNRVYTPIASDLYLQDKHDELAILTKSVAKWTFSLSFPAICLMVVFPGELLSVFGRGFDDGIPALRLLAIGILFLAGTGPVTTTLMVAGRPRLALVDYILVVVTEISLSFWLIPSLGITGAGVVVLVGMALNNVLPLLQVWKIVGFHVFRFDFWKPAAAGASSVMIARLIISVLGISGPVAAGTAIGITGLAYLILLLLFGFSPEDKDLFNSLTRRVKGQQQ